MNNFNGFGKTMVEYMIKKKIQRGNQEPLIQLNEVNIPWR